MNASTAYSAGNAWYQQPNYFDYNDGSAKSFIAGMVRLDGLIKQYHFFYHTTANYDVVYIFVQNEEGYWQRLLFGNVSTTKYGTAISGAEGMFYNGSKAPFNNTYSTAITLFGDGVPTIWNAEVPQSAVYLNYSGTARWHSGNFNVLQTWMSPQRPQIVDGVCKKSTIINNALSGISAIPTFLPIDLYVGQTTGLITSNVVNLIPFAELPEIYFTNINNLAEGADLKMAKDTYKVFPFSKKSDTWDSANSSNGSYRYGLGVRKA
jgi:hypothetical protein